MVRSIATLCLLLAVSQLLPAICEAQCTLCFGGDDANLTKTVGGAADGVPCSLLISDVNIDEEACRDLQLLGFRYCDCPSYPTEHFCPLCKDSFKDIPNRFKLIPGTDDTCDDKLFVSIDDVESCEEAMKPGFACGCPEAEEPACQICGDSNDISNFSQDRLTVNTVGSYMCQEWADQAVLGDLDLEQCALVSAEALEFCGCPRAATEVPEETTSTDMTNATTPPVDETDTPPTEDNDSSAYIRSSVAFVSVVTAMSAFLSQMLLL